MQDKKYLHYKDRLQALLSRKDVLSILNPGNNNKSQETLKRPEEIKTRNIPKRQVSAVFNQTAPMPKKDAEDVISVHLHESSHASSRTKASIRDQEGDNLEKRLQARKRASSLKPQREEEKPEKSKISKIEMYQNEIEQIMEKYAEEKLMRMQIIKKKYKEQDNEIKAMQGNGISQTEIFGKLREELDRNLKKELDELQQELQRERKEKITELRMRYDT